jgi:hypothetical protein
LIFHGAARIIDGWLALLRSVKAAWRAFPGDLMALVVMRACGISRPTRVVSHKGVSAFLVEDPRAGRYLDRQAMPITAQTLGRYVFARETLPEHLVRHELEHVRQWRRYGPLFLPAYFASSARAIARRRHPYRDNRYELAARSREIAPRSGPAGSSDR